MVRTGLWFEQRERRRAWRKFTREDVIQTYKRFFTWRFLRDRFHILHLFLCRLRLLSEVQPTSSTSPVRTRNPPWKSGASAPRRVSYWIGFSRRANPKAATTDEALSPLFLTRPCKGRSSTVAPAAGISTVATSHYRPAANLVAKRCGRFAASIRS